MRTLECGSIGFGWFVAFDYCICLSHSMHIDYYLVNNNNNNNKAFSPKQVGVG